MRNIDSPDDRLERATRARLAKLASLPVDTTKAAACLRALVDQECGPVVHQHRRRLWVWPAWTGVAAAILIAATLLVVLLGGNSAVYAAPAEMVRLHHDLVAGRVPVIPVTNVDEARQAIESRWPDAPSLPPLPGDNIHACCLSGIKSRQVACILLRQGDTPVTVIVARAEDLRSAKGPTTIHGGRAYTMMSRDGLNMVMTRHEDRWVCLMGEAPQDKLIELAQAMTP